MDRCTLVTDPGVIGVTLAARPMPCDAWPMKNKSFVQSFFLDEEVARIAQGHNPVGCLPPEEILKWAARELRDHRRAMTAALGQAAKAADDVRFLERLFRLEDTRK